MRRVLIAAGLALLVHGFLLASGSGWLRKKSLKKRRLEMVTLTLSYYRPQKAEVEVKHSQQRKRKQRPKPRLRSKPRRKTPKLPAPVKPLPRAREDISGSKTDAEHQPAKGEGKPTIPDTSLSKGAVEETASSGTRMASKGPAGTSLRRAIPIYKENPPPPYPKVARRRGYEGITLLEVLVNTEGKVDDVRISSSSGFSVLDRAAKASVRKWVFVPAMRGNEKVEMWVRIPIRFQLK